ncbi:MAG: phosphoribosyl transferase [Deltaproteobacteria bacterium RBG_16_54_11]|jgi:predicted phosphoribosyltransferase|nr:MAG: phosphoribosyl transferase [Deltaproteobacteria bacterium RBG_16_54_11]
MALFRDRFHAGQVLAEKVRKYAGSPALLVLGLPRGGVPVASEVAKALRAPLDVFIVRKLGVPGHTELAMGAIASGGVRVLNEEVVQSLNIPDSVIDQVAAQEQRELERREIVYRGKRPAHAIEGRTLILIDDGLATGASMRAAVVALRKREPRHIIVAVPTAAPDTCATFENQVDEIICAATPEPFVAVGRWYEDFSQTTDEEVREILEQAETWVVQE